MNRLFGYWHEWQLLKCSINSSLPARMMAWTWEADLMINIEENGLDKQIEKLPVIISKKIQTTTGHQLAMGQYLKEHNLTD